jgi:hypothetical protein
MRRTTYLSIKVSRTAGELAGTRAMFERFFPDDLGDIPFGVLDQYVLSLGMPPAACLLVSMKERVLGYKFRNRKPHESSTHL